MAASGELLRILKRCHIGSFHADSRMVIVLWLSLFWQGFLLGIGDVGGVFGGDSSRILIEWNAFS
jgi:hypothetical protein